MPTKAEIFEWKVKAAAKAELQAWNARQVAEKVEKRHRGEVAESIALAGKVISKHLLEIQEVPTVVIEERGRGRRWLRRTAAEEPSLQGWLIAEEVSGQDGSVERGGIKLVRRHQLVLSTKGDFYLRTDEEHLDPQQPCKATDKTHPWAEAWPVSDLARLAIFPKPEEAALRPNRDLVLAGLTALLAQSIS